VADFVHSILIPKLPLLLKTLVAQAFQPVLAQG
jgi:hypothetical protein